MLIKISNYKEEYVPTHEHPLVKTTDSPNCPICGDALAKKDWVERGIKKAGGTRRNRYIERRCCKKCSKTYRLLPDDLLPCKHYEAELIKKVINDDYEFSDDELLDMEQFPCDTTLSRWKA